MRKTKVFAGSSHPELSTLIVNKLGVEAGQAILKRFANKETAIELGVSVRNDDVFIIQSGSDTVNDHLMELLIMINACKTASARRITAVMPYFPYSKQSKKKKYRGVISAKLVANMLSVAGVDHIITMDLHASQMQGFFHRPVDNLLAEPPIAKWVMERVPDYLNGVVVSKNAGGAKRVTSLADRLKIDFALIHKEKKRRPNFPDVVPPSATHSPSRTPVMGRSTASSVCDGEGADNESDPESVDRASPFALLRPGSACDKHPPRSQPVRAGGGLTLVGDVTGKVVFILDDIIDSVHSFLDAADHVMHNCNAARVYLIATHGILSGDALSEIEACDSVHRLVITNSFPIPESKRSLTTKLSIIDVSSTLAEAIRRTHNGESISYLNWNHV